MTGSSLGGEQKARPPFRCDFGAVWLSRTLIQATSGHVMVAWTLPDPYGSQGHHPCSRTARNKDGQLHRFNPLLIEPRYMLAY
jgi:hypothetical protein